jgi:hypothetical protein
VPLYVVRHPQGEEELWQVFQNRNEAELAIRQHIADTLALLVDYPLASTLQQFALGESDFDSVLAFYSLWFAPLCGHISLDRV